ncbi:MAG TPA: DUF362 domain-containing protein, partial [bacterium]|nr:DUF362 domain-containing protein [bacterium]
MKPRIAKITSYEDIEHIREFVRDTVVSFFSESAQHAGSNEKPLVVIKPNWIQESHEKESDVWIPLITNPEIILAAVDSVCEYFEDRVTVCVCDAPHTYADFGKIISRGDFAHKLEALKSRRRNAVIEVLDLRREVWTVRNGVVTDRRPNEPDPRGYVSFNLGNESLFHGHGGEGRYYGADYDSSIVNRHHHGAVHEYLLAGTPVKCDYFINLPKMKTHKKTGVTCCLKNLVGINGDKNWLPHHTEGSPENGGDEFAEDSAAGGVERALKKAARKAASSIPVIGPWAFGKIRSAGKTILGDSDVTVRNGNWHGNDTCWRMVLDLNRALLYGDANGLLDPGGKKRYLAIIDGIVGGQGNGPLEPDAAAAGV